MKEVLYTIPVNEGFEADDECPFCFMERAEEERALRYVAGNAANYMETAVRAATARVGFCTHHMKSLYDFGNSLGAALLLQTHYTSVLDELKKKAKNPEIPAKKGLFAKKAAPADTPYYEVLASREHSCYICDKIEYNMSRCYHTFFELLREDEFRAKVKNSKGFCVRHFARMLKEAERYLPENQKDWFYPTVYKLMVENMERVQEDLEWFIAKFDYRNASEPWKNSQDALPRTMQKLQGLHPSDPPYKNK